MVGLQNTVHSHAPVISGAYHIPRSIYQALHDHLKNVIIGVIKQTQIVDKLNVITMTKAVQMMLEAYNRMKVR